MTASLALGQLSDMAGRAGEWYEKAKEVLRQHDELKELNIALTDGLKESQSQSQQLPSLEALRARILKSLNAGEQSKLYKRVKAELDQLLPPG